MTAKKLTPKGELRKKELLEKALELFGKKGYQATTIDDIVKAGHTGKGTFYWYWKSKDELFLELLSLKFGSYLNALNNIRSMQLSASDKLMMLIGEVAFLLVKYRELCKLVYVLISDNLEGVNAEVLKVTGDFYRHFRDVLTEIIKNGQQEKNFSAEFDAEYLATILFSIVDGIILQEKLMQVNYSLPKLGETLVNLLKNGVMVNPKQE